VDIDDKFEKPWVSEDTGKDMYVGEGEMLVSDLVRIREARIRPFKMKRFGYVD